MLISLHLEDKFKNLAIGNGAILRESPCNERYQT